MYKTQDGNVKTPGTLAEMPGSMSTVRAVTKELRGKYIRMERDRMFKSTLDRLLECDESGNLISRPVTCASTGETRGIVVVDGAGGGKTSLVRHALSNHPALQPSPTTMPCVTISVPSPATMKSVGLEILRASGYTELEKKRVAYDIWNQVRYRFQILGTVVLWIDEAHDLFPNGSKSEAPQILKTLKSLMQRDAAVIVILSGVESLWDSISFDYQVERRYLKFELPPVTIAADCRLVWNLMGGFCDRAGLAGPERGDLVERLIHAGRHRFGLCIEYMISAIEIALTRGDDKLHIQHFVDAFFMQEGCQMGSNVFLARRWSSIDLSRRGARRAD